MIALGLALVLAGLFWPWLSRWGASLGLGKLPGDILIEKENFSVYFPLTTSILISLILSLLFWLFRK